MIEGKVLVTGSNGQLGQCFKEVVGYYIRNYDYIFTTREQFDITNYDMMEKYLEEKQDIKIIINCAAYTDVKNAETEDGYKQSNLININGAQNLALLCKKFNIFLIHFGTDYMYGCKEQKPLGEGLFKRTLQEDYNPFCVAKKMNNYGMTKFLGVHNIFKELKSRNNFVVIVTSWLYSEYGKNFVKTIRERVKEEEKTEVVYTQIGSPTYAKDLAKYVIDIIENHDCKFVDDGFNLINFSNLGIASWYDMAKLIEDFYSLDNNKITPRKEPFDDIPRPNYSVLDNSKIIENCGEKPYIRHWVSAMVECLYSIRNKEYFNKKEEV